MENKVWFSLIKPIKQGLLILNKDVKLQFEMNLKHSELSKNGHAICITF